MINDYPPILLILLLLSLLSLSWRIRYSNYCCLVLLLYTIFLFCLWLTHSYLEQQNINIKRQVGLKLPRRHTGILTFKYLMIHFLYIELEKVIPSEFFFSNLPIISFLPVLQLQAIWMMLYQ